MEVTPTTSKADIVKSIIEAGTYKILLPLLAKKAVAKYAWLGIGWVNPILMFVLDIGIDIFYDKTIMLTFFGVTHVVVGEQVDGFEDAVTELEEQINSHEGDLNAEAVKRASEQFDKRLSDLINYNT